MKTRIIKIEKYIDPRLNPSNTRNNLMRHSGVITLIESSKSGQGNIETHYIMNSEIDPEERGLTYAEIIYKLLKYDKAIEHLLCKEVISFVNSVSMSLQEEISIYKEVINIMDSMNAEFCMNFSDNSKIKTLVYNIP